MDTERYIAIKLNDSDFYRKLSQVNQATDEAVKKIKQMNQSLEELGKYMAGVGAVGQAGIGLAVKQFADFEQAFVNLKKVMPEDVATLSLLALPLQPMV